MSEFSNKKHKYPKKHIYGWSYSWRVLYVKTLVSFWRYINSVSGHSAGSSVAKLCMKLGNRWTCSRARNFPGKRLGEGNKFLYHSPLKEVSPHLFYSVNQLSSLQKDLLQVTCNYVS